MLTLLRSTRDVLRICRIRNADLDAAVGRVALLRFIGRRRSSGRAAYLRLTTARSFGGDIESRDVEQFPQLRGNSFSTPLREPLVIADLTFHLTADTARIAMTSHDNPFNPTISLYGRHERF